MVEMTKKGKKTHHILSSFLLNGKKSFEANSKLSNVQLQKENTVYFPTLPEQKSADI